MKKSTNDSYDDLEIFTGKARWRRKHRVTISKNHTLSFNSAFSNKANLEEKTHVVLMYSPKRREIIFDFTEDANAPGAYGLIGKGGPITVAPRSFFYTYDFDIDEIAGKYEPHRQRIPKIGECWLIRLDEKLPK
jgi:hypothetical protein